MKPGEAEALCSSAFVLQVENAPQAQRQENLVNLELAEA